MFKGFEPVYTKTSKVLILGSFPSVKSREVDFYYGNPRNRFWTTIGNIHGVKIGNSIEEKIQFLKSHDIALWDIVGRCNIEGSMDTNIRDEEIVDLGPILRETSLKAIFLNGQKSYSLFMRKYSSLEIRKVLLPSTSPANVRFDEKEWFNAFESINVR